MKKIIILRYLAVLLVVVGLMQCSHLWWIPLLSAARWSSTRLKYSAENTIFTNNVFLDGETPQQYEYLKDVSKSKEDPHEEIDIVQHEEESYKKFKLPTVVGKKVFTRLVPLIKPTPYPVERIYDSSKYSKFETMQQSECASYTEDIAYSQPLERKGVIQIPKNITSLDMLNLWEDFSPSEVRSVMTPSMIELSDDISIKGKVHLAPLIENSHIQETDFDEYFTNNYDTFRIMSKIQDPQDTILDRWKRDMNEKNFVLNSEKFNENQKEDHLPIWIRTYKRTNPLNLVLKSLCKVHNIEESILFVTIDGESFLEVIEELVKYRCVKMRIYFHSFVHTAKNFVREGNSTLYKEIWETQAEKRSFKLFSHASYGLYLCLMKYKYPYVITIEDDIKPLPDFYNYHRSLYRLTLSENSPFLSVLVSPGGVNLPCNYINTALYDSGVIHNMPYESLGLKHQVCSVNDLDHVVPEVYHTIWGSGISYRLFRRMWFTWFKLPNRFDFFLGTLMRDLRKHDERNIIPCSPRVQQIANSGVNGGNTGNPRYWEVVGPYATKRQAEDDAKKWSCRGREYTMLITDGFNTSHLES